jgi:hypothetical protein
LEVCFKEAQTTFITENPPSNSSSIGEKVKTGISFFDPESLQLYRSWGGLQGQKNVCVENASVCGGKAWHLLPSLPCPPHRELLSSLFPTLVRPLFFLHWNSAQRRQPVSLPEAATAPSCITSPRTVLSSGVLPPATESRLTD